MLTLKRLLQLRDDPARLRAEADAELQREEQEAARRAAEGPTEEEFASWDAKRRAEYIERLAAETEEQEREREERERAERYAEVEAAIADLESTIAADAASGTVLLVQLMELLTDQRARARRLHELRRELEQAGGPPAPPLKVPSLESYGSTFEESGEGLEGDAREVHVAVLRLIDPDGVQHRAGVRHRRRQALQREYQTALDYIERTEPEVRALKAGRIVDVPSRNGVELYPGPRRGAGSRQWRAIRTAKERDRKVAAMENALQEARETVERTQHAAIKSSITRKPEALTSDPQDGTPYVQVAGVRPEDPPTRFVPKWLADATDGVKQP